MAQPSETKSQVFSSADRIRQLNDIDRDIAKLVNSAGLAIKVLANDKSPEVSTAKTTVEERKAAFRTATSQYFALLSSIDVRLRRQVYALEEAGILDADSVASASMGSFRSDATGSAGPGSTAGAGAGAGPSNPLEISWLNSRKDTVGKDKEAESWAAAREFIGRLKAESDGGDGSAKVDEMDTD